MEQCTVEITRHIYYNIVFNFDFKCRNSTGPRTIIIRKSGHLANRITKIIRKERLASKSFT